jgi:sugar/nucleoside kinase (ribokinase family)
MIKMTETDYNFDVTGIGNACLDIVDTVTQEFLDRFKMKKSHCIYIDRAMLNDIKTSLPHHQLISGGSVANTIHCLKALNLNVSFQGIIAHDNEGATFKSDLIQNNIKDFLAYTTEDGLGTTQVCCLITPDGDRSFASYDGAARTLAREHLRMDVIAQSSITYFDGYTMYSPTAEDAFMAAVETAQSSGKRAAFNPADLSIINSFPNATKKLANISDILLCNLTEARALFGYETLEECAVNLPRQKQAGAITNGSQGALAFMNGEILYLPPSNHTKTPMDTNGAGDHFAAGILYGILKHSSLETMSRLAHLCALDCISHMGARPLGSLTHLIDTAESMAA